jgi:hypothetical protein
MRWLSQTKGTDDPAILMAFCRIVIGDRRSSGHTVANTVAVKMRRQDTQMHDVGILLHLWKP